MQCARRLKRMIPYRVVAPFEYLHPHSSFRVNLAAILLQPCLSACPYHSLVLHRLWIHISTSKLFVRCYELNARHGTIRTALYGANAAR